MTEKGTAIAPRSPDMSAIHKVLMQGNLASLSDAQKVSYFEAVCESVGLNPLTAPFEFIKFQGKEVMYAKRNCTDQLRSIHHISVNIKSREVIDGCLVVTAQAVHPTGRVDESVGAVPIEGLKGEARSNAIMKCECVPIEYEILTKTGFKSPMEIKTGDLVASVDVSDGSMHWTPLQGVSVYDNQKVTKYGNTTVGFEITDGHSWICQSAQGGNRQLKPFEAIKSGNYLMLTGVMENEDSVLTDQEAALLGWIVTDGTIKMHNGKFYRASVCQSKGDNFENIEWACKAVGKVTKGVTDNREHGWLDQHWWYLSVEQTANLFEKCGFRSLDDLPRITLNLSHSARSAMLDAMMRADGDSRGVFAKTKPQVMEAFQILSTLNGILLGRMKSRTQPRATKPIYHQRQLSYTRVARQNLGADESRETTVWCPTTRHGTWVCRTDEGQIFVTGNTKAKRRVTLSICGLSFLDESELESIGEYKRVPVPDRRRQAPQEAQRPSLKEMALEHAKQKTPLEIQLEASIVSTTHEAPPEIPPDLFDSVEPPEDVFVPSLDRMVPEFDACKNAHDLDVWYARYAPLRPKLDKEVREAMGRVYARKRKEFGMKVNPRATVTTFKHTDAGFVEVGSREE